ncbi:MAG: TIGR04066 family peptide maturation system protein [Clostridia bacterium]|nr:TIGR04066 family peptide maturation system protein [Clostridia bacterium]
MNKKEKMLIYPFDLETTPLLRHKNLVTHYDIAAVAAPNGWGTNGKDACCTDGGPEIGMKITSNFEKALEACDTVFFAQTEVPLDFNRSIYPRLLKTIEANKNLISCLPLDSEVIKELSKKCEEKGTTFRSLCESSEHKILPHNIEEIYDINVPVVFVVGITERTHKFEIQLALREKFLKEGYKVGQIGTKNYCELMDFYSFPHQLFDSNLTESQKIVHFNHYIKRIEVKDKPDVIIIGVPGGTMPINKVFTCKFGVLAYEISQAVVPDVAVVSTSFEDYKPEYFEVLSQSIRYKLGFAPTCFNLSNTLLDWQSSKLEKVMNYFTLDSAGVDKKIKSLSGLKTPVFNVLNKQSSDALGNYILGQLADYGEVNSF